MSKPRKEIIVGKEYGWLTVLGQADKDRTGHIRWLVRCRCGKEYPVLTGFLSKENCKCIDCAKAQDRKRLSGPGDVINGFEILSEVGKRDGGAILYECKCLKCGSTSIRTRGSLAAGKGNGCRSCRPNYHFEIADGVAHGSLPDGTGFTIDSDLISEFTKFNWFINNKGYIQRSNRGLPKMMLHWFVMGVDRRHENPIDHINRDKTDCRRNNLRVVTLKQNSMNHSKASTNRSGYIGVFWHKHKGKWSSFIYTNGRHLYFGYFEDKVSAAQCYNYACELLRGEYAGELNDVPDAPCELKERVYRKCLPFMNAETIAAAEAAFLLKEA